MHDPPIGGHSSNLVIYQRMKTYFYWPGLKKDVEKYVQLCDACKRSKAENCKYPGLLQPLKIPDQTWKDISLDFMEGLPKSQGSDTILVVIDRFTKYGHFIPLNGHYYSTISVSTVL